MFSSRGQKVKTSCYKIVENTNHHLRWDFLTLATKESSVSVNNFDWIFYLQSKSLTELFNFTQSCFPVLQFIENINSSYEISLRRHQKIFCFPDKKVWLQHISLLQNQYLTWLPGIESVLLVIIFIFPVQANYWKHKIILWYF